MPRLRPVSGCAALGPDAVARCLRCNAVLRRTRQDSLGRGLANRRPVPVQRRLPMSLMTVSTAGMRLSANLLSGPEGLERHGIGIVRGDHDRAPFLRTSMNLRARADDEAREIQGASARGGK